MVCPKCGCKVGIGSVYLDEVTYRQNVRGFNADGVLEISGEYEFDETGGMHRRLRCGNCQHEFPLADDAEIAFV